jgi:hypothetical protein
MINIHAFSLHKYSSLSGSRGEKIIPARMCWTTASQVNKKIDKIGDELIEQQTSKPDMSSKMERCAPLKSTTRNKLRMLVQGLLDL